MSLVKISGNASGTGIFTVAAPNSNTDRTLTLPDATGTVQVSGNPISGTTGSFSGDLSFNSGYGSSAVAYGCRAWVNFNGTGTVAIRASGNVSSITDNGVGQYTVNLTNAMPDANYCWQINAQDANNGMGVPTAQADPTRTVTTTALPIIYNYPPDTAFYDAPVFTVAIFR
jgi:hypothetical protein